MSVCLKGYAENVATFEAASGVAKGDLVKISANNKVAKSTQGEAFCGVVLDVRNGYASVQLSGYISVSSSGTVNLGYQNLAVDANGKATVLNDVLQADTTTGEVSVTAGGRAILVVEVDSDNNKIGIIL